MQAPTHILAGIILQRATGFTRYSGMNTILLFVLSIFVHGVFDKLAISTYHPKQAYFSDPFWVVYHLVVWLIAIMFLYIWGSNFKWGILFSLLPDIDWLIIYCQQILGIQDSAYQTPLIHNSINLLLDNTTPLYLLNQLPDNTLNPFALIWELLFVIVLLGIIHTLNNRRRNIHF